MRNDIFTPYKIFYWRDRVEDLLRGEIPNPVFVTIDPSNRCNSKCPHCFVNEYKQDQAILDKDIMLKTIDELSRGVHAIALCGGGEPLCNPSTLDAMIRCREDELQVGLITNGNLFTNNTMDEALRSCSFIRLSVDAPNPTVYKTMHGIDGFRKLVSDIKYLTDNKKETEISASYLISEANYKSIPSFAKLMNELNVDRITYKYIYTGYNGLDLGYVDKDFIKSKHEVLDKLLTEAKQYEGKMKVSFRHPTTFLSDKIESLNKLYKKCYVAPLNMVTVQANGNVVMCCDRRGQLVMGNVYKESFWDIWDNNAKKVYNSINVNACPFRCKSTEYNQLIKDWKDFDWGMI